VGAMDVGDIDGCVVGPKEGLKVGLWLDGVEVLIFVGWMVGLLDR